MFRVLCTLLVASILGVPALAAPAPKRKPVSAKPAPAKTNPSLEAFEIDLQRFPSEICALEWGVAAHRHIDYLNRRIAFLRKTEAFRREADDLLDYRIQVEHWLNVWRDLIRAHECFDPVEDRRAALERVRAAIGEEAYWQGFLWPPIATHMLLRRD